MEAIVKITEKDGKTVVSARELYLALGYNESLWSKWYKKNIVTNRLCIENEDWVLLVPMTSEGKKGQFGQDFAITIDFAKRLSMMARTEKGEEVRRYFIDCEEKAKQQSILSPAELLLQQCQMLVESERRISKVEIDQKELSEKVALIEAKQHTTPVNFFAVIGYATLMKIQVDLKTAAKIGKRAVNLCKEMGMTTGTIPDPRFGIVRVYPRSILEQVFAEVFKPTIA